MTVQELIRKLEEVQKVTGSQAQVYGPSEKRSLTVQVECDHKKLTVYVGPPKEDAGSTGPKP